MPRKSKSKRKGSNKAQGTGLTDASETHGQTEEVKQVEGICAFVCRGSCGAVLDRMFTCANPTCTYFGRPMEQAAVDFVCKKCGAIRDTGPGLCCQQLCSAFLRGNEEKKPVLILSQFPAKVVATDCGLHIPQLKRYELPTLVVQPNLDTTWAGRHVIFSHVKIDGSETRVADNHVVAMPGQRLRLSLQYACSWRASPDDYCPGCVVQWYVGMKPPFGDVNPLTMNLVRTFSSGQRGSASEDFEAPQFPGVYYITSNISLQYGFVPMSFENSPHNAIAVVQVAYCDRWRVENHKLLAQPVRASIEAFFFLGGPARHPRHRTQNPRGCPCVLGGLEGPLLGRIFSFLGPYRD